MTTQPMETRLCRDHAPLAGHQIALTAQGTGALQRGEVFGQACDFTCYCAIIRPSTDACTSKLAVGLVL